ncbi:bifunctional metallophosphatase/5'-nucleotidase [Desertivirga brevis]|uniref:bifunctional metallophosphatase/5'-nucleotidase n=1 Tax=Desertivirga brevis TaxID=2810310 RepID=UPI001A9635BD|nr:metallophosphatase [Pedobacter sp. SYSU D00873]
MNRRSFIKNTLTGSAMLTLGLHSESLFAKDDFVKITILHTNDVHSRIDPFPMDDKNYPGRGGIAPRATLIKKIRGEEKNVMLFDAGDVFQGTPYFNFFGGELELKLMSLLGYDAGTMGNHDFDNGLEGFEKQIKHAKFPIITSNYDFSDTILAGKTQEFAVYVKDGIKIGVFGLGIDLEGLVNKQQYGNTRYLDPIKKAQYWETYLKEEEKCNLVICLSHLGYKYQNDKVSDIVIAKNTRYLDLIIGGHTHTFLDMPDAVKNLSSKSVIINQVGFAGLNLGRLDFVLERNTGAKKGYTSAVEPVTTYLKN